MKNSRKNYPKATTYGRYKRDALRTEPDYTGAVGRLAVHPDKVRLLHALLGLVTESGELVDQLKQHLFYGSSLDLVNLEEEGGDMFWYLAVLADFLGHRNFTKMLNLNIAKLKTRYPEKFDEQKALSRDLEAERQVLEGVVDASKMKQCPRCLTLTENDADNCPHCNYEF